MTHITVGQLIEKLEKFNPDTPVLVEWPDGDGGLLAQDVKKQKLPDRIYAAITTELKE